MNRREWLLDASMRTTVELALDSGMFEFVHYDFDRDVYTIRAASSTFEVTTRTLEDSNAWGKMREFRASMAKK